MRMKIIVLTAAIVCAVFLSACTMAARPPAGGTEPLPALKEPVPVRQNMWLVEEGSPDG